MEAIIYLLVGLGVLFLLVGAILFVLSRKKPEALIPLVSFLRRFSWFRKKSDQAALKTLAQNPEALQEVEEIGGKEARLLEKMLSGGSEQERLKKLERIQELSDKGDLKGAAQVLAEKSKSPDDARAKQKARDARRRKKKAARKQKKRSR